MSTATAHNACSSLISTVLCRLNMSTLHILKSRDISVASASSFIIVVAVGFFGLLMVCVGSSSYYRQRFARRQAAILGSASQAQVPLTPPQLWDVSCPEMKEGPVLLHAADWAYVQASLYPLQGRHPH